MEGPVMLHTLGWAFFWVVMAVIVIVTRYFRSRERQEMQRTIRAAIEHGQPLPPEMIDAMTRDARWSPRPRNDLRNGVILVFIGASLAAFGYILGLNPDAEDARYPMMAIGAIPGCLGVAFLLVGLFTGKRS
jgi:hypothetical protein